MVALLDTSALAKVVVDEAESAAMVYWLDDQAPSTSLVISALAVVELRRLARRLDVDPAAVVSVLAGVDVVPVTEAMLHHAATLPQPYLRTLDAVHLATALAIEAHELVTYDARLAEGAVQEGLRVRAPA